MNYDLLAIDLDGTLLDRSGHVSAENIDALRRAREAGLLVTLCTGRALIECARVIRKTGQTDPVIVSGGAMIADPSTGETLDRATIDPSLVQRVTAFLHDHGHASVILKDPHPTSYDYLVVTPEGGQLDLATRWWFDAMRVRVRQHAGLHLDEHPEHSVRVGVAQANEPVDELAAEMRRVFGHEATLQHFRGATLPTDRVQMGITSVHIVEVFNQTADKWQAIERLAGRVGIDPARTAAIGDQLNDMEMIRHAGLGIAMANAAPEITGVAKRITGDHNHHGVAEAIDKIISGEW